MSSVTEENNKGNETGGGEQTSELPDYSPTPEQEQKLHMLLTLLARCQEEEVKIFITGGYAIDALCGRLTRVHNDFDLYIEQESRGKFEEIIRDLGFSPTEEKVGQIEKNVSVNASFSPPLRLEYGTIEQAIGFIEKIDGSINTETMELFFPKFPIGNLKGQPIWTPTLVGLKKMAEVNDLIFKRSGGPEYSHREWREQVFKVLESRGIP